MNPSLNFLLSPIFDGALAPAHCADLAKSGLTEPTIRAQRICSVPPSPSMLHGLLGFDLPAMRSALLFPFPDPAGGFMDHVRMKIFPTLVKVRRAGRSRYVPEDELQPDEHKLETLKYVQPKGSEPRLYFVRSVLPLVMDSSTALYVLEGEKKALAAAQLGLAAIGIAGIHGWHASGVRQLLADFARIPLVGRMVELVPDGDVATNQAVQAGAADFADALHHVGAHSRIVLLPVAA